MLKEYKVFKSLILGAVLVVFIALLHNWTDVHAEEEYDEMKYKTVASFEEFEELYMSNDTLFQYTAEEFESLDKIWYIDIEEPGWFVFSAYNVRFGDGTYTDEGGSVYMYPNAMLIDAETCFHSYKNLNGEDYKIRDINWWFLTKGRYYFKLKSIQGRNRKIQGDKIVRCRAYFIPNKLGLTIDSVSYNDDNSLATVYFNPISENIHQIALYDTEVKNYNDMVSSGSHRIKYRSGYYDSGSGSADTAGQKEIASYVSDGIEIDKNGTYSLVIKYKDDEYKDYRFAITFTIDKIGAEASKVEAKSLKMSRKKATMKPDETINLSVTFKPKNVTEKTVTWKTSNKKVATVDENGVVTAKKKGTCVITAISSNGKKAKCKITVKK